MSFPTRINISIPTDDEGYIGRECPIATSQGYFKVKPGTGLTGKDLPCHCPYCGHVASPNKFFTKDQIEFAKSAVYRELVGAVRNELKKMEFDIQPRGPFGIGISMKLKPGQPIPLKRYRERTLETNVCCSNFTLDYSVYGIFAFCPDCGTHNSLQILQKNIDLLRKQLLLADAQDEADLKRHLIEDALENCVSSFDGFAREACRIAGCRSADAGQCENLSFQNLHRAAKRLASLFKVDLTKSVSLAEWNASHIGFMRRHILAHRGGVVDQHYLDETGEARTLLGRRVAVTPADVESLAETVLKLGRWLAENLSLCAEVRPPSSATERVASGRD
jgi:hypothetical protein